MTIPIIRYENLKACPFCGCKNIFIEGLMEEMERITKEDYDDRDDKDQSFVAFIRENAYEFVVYCNECGAQVFGDTIESAVKKWNRRAHKEAEE